MPESHDAYPAELEARLVGVVRAGRNPADQGSQDTAFAFGQRCRAPGVRPSMQSVGDASDNATGESFFATLECALPERHRFTNRVEARMHVSQSIEGWYNTQRRQSALGYLSPYEFERRNLHPL